MKKIAAIKKILRANKEILRDRYKVKRIGLFGSYVRGDTHSGSDVDVLVEFSDTISLLRLVSLENYLTGLIGIKVDVVPREDIRRELKDAILKEAVYL
jgi:uncharacterized protein